MEVNDQLHVPASLPLGKVSWYSLNRRLGGPQSKSGCFMKLHWMFVSHTTVATKWAWYELPQDSFNSFIDTNLIHNFVLYKLHKIKFLYMFRASSAHLQEVNDVNCTCMQPLVFSFSAGGCHVHFLRGDCREWEYQRLHTCIINIIDLLKMSGWRSKHVEELNFM